MVVPKIFENTQCQFICDRRVKHHSLVACISAGGDSIRPLILSNQQQSREIFQTPVRKGVDLSIRVERSAYMNTDIFRDWVYDYLIPFVQKKRIKLFTKSKVDFIFR